MKVFDSDAHVEESEETFASLKQDFGDAAPRVVEGAKRAFWLIEGRSFPRLSGLGVHTFGSPHVRREAGHVDPQRRARIESQELRDPAARLQDMDHERIDVSVVFPTLFLVWPLADNAALARALCRSYNEWIAAKCSVLTLGTAGHMTLSDRRLELSMPRRRRTRCPFACMWAGRTRRSQISTTMSTRP